jgi:ankyrin repeat protein
VKYLLQHGADPNLGPATGGGINESNAYRVVDDSGANLRSAAQNGNVESLDLLLKYGAVHSNAATLHAAVDGGSLTMIFHLLNLGVDVDQLDTYKTMGFPCYTTPLLRAIKHGKSDVIRALLNAGASTNIRIGEYFSDKTALELVQEDGVSTEIRRMVEEAGTNPEVI